MSAPSTFSWSHRGCIVKKILPLEHKQIVKELDVLRAGQHVTDPDPESKFQVLQKYTQDFTKLALEGKIDPVIGRDEEMRRVLQILSRRSKIIPYLSVSQAWKDGHRRRPCKKIVDGTCLIR